MCCISRLQWHSFCVPRGSRQIFQGVLRSKREGLYTHDNDGTLVRVSFGENHEFSTVFVNETSASLSSEQHLQLKGIFKISIDDNNIDLYACVYLVRNIDRVCDVWIYRNRIAREYRWSGRSRGSDRSIGRKNENETRKTWFKREAHSEKL